MGKLEGRVAFVTGAARGQGRSHALRLAQEGADIIAVDVCDQLGTVPYTMARPADLDETVRQVEKLDRRIVASRTDVRDGAAVRAALDEGVAQLGRLDVVVANAGICSYSSADDLSDEVWDEMLAVNLTGVFRSIRPAIPHLKAAGGGSIVITSSTAGIMGFAGLAHYVSAKHGVVGLMKSLAIELGPHSIRVNTVHPTSVDTDMVHNTATYGLFLPDRDPDRITREEAGDAFATMNILPIPWVDPVDISNAVLFLASDDARYVTGVQLPVDAGAVVK